MMKSQAAHSDEHPGSKQRFTSQRYRDFTGVKSSPMVILSNRHPATARRHSRVNGGHSLMSSTDTRGSVIFGVCQHDPERWREFDSIYRPMLFAFLRKQGLPESDASDVVQDIFVKLLGKIQTYDREQCKFRTWLFAVAHHALVDHARRRASQKKALDGWAATMLRASASDSLKMAEEWVKLHRKKILKYALESVRDRTKPKSWACFEQRILRDRPGIEIAAELHIEPSTVFVNAHRVLMRVRTVCQEFDEDMSDGFDSGLSGRD
jgi:RNA polymerase sigma factor (sigma-70 family)